MAAERNVTALVAVQKLEDAGPALARTGRPRVQPPDTSRLCSGWRKRAVRIGARPHARDLTNEHVRTQRDVDGVVWGDGEAAERSSESRSCAVGRGVEEALVDCLERRCANARALRVMAGGGDRGCDLMLFPRRIE